MSRECPDCGCAMLFVLKDEDISETYGVEMAPPEANGWLCPICEQFWRDDEVEEAQ